MITYIKKELSNYYVEFEQELNPELYTNIGSTYNDFIANKWIKLSEEQVAFHNENPNATIKEVLEMQLADNTVTRTLEQAKQEKINEIIMYDLSDSVNSFSINGVITTWLNVQERLNYRQSVEDAKLMENETITFFVDNYQLEVETSKASTMLVALQMYADACFIKTKQHQIAVQQLTTIEEVDNYDYTVGYPERLNFVIE